MVKFINDHYMFHAVSDDLVEGERERERESEGDLIIDLTKFLVEFKK